MNFIPFETVITADWLNSVDRLVWGLLGGHSDPGYILSAIGAPAEAPSDGKLYARRNQAWQEVTTVHNSLTLRDSADAHPVAAITGLQTNLNAKANSADVYTKTQSDARYLTDAPVNTNQYARQNGLWQIVAATGGGGTSVHGALTGRDDADQHPIAAISGLATALTNRVATTEYANLFSNTSTVASWNSTTAYVVSNIVKHNGLYYRALKNSTNVTPGADNTNDVWQNITLDGLGQQIKINAMEIGDPHAIAAHTDLVSYIAEVDARLALIEDTTTSVTASTTYYVDNYSNGFTRVYVPSITDGVTARFALATTPNTNGAIFPNVAAIPDQAAVWADFAGTLGKVKTAQNIDVLGSALKDWITKSAVLTLHKDNTDPAHPNLIVDQINLPASPGSSLKLGALSNVADAVNTAAVGKVLSTTSVGLWAATDPVAGPLSGLSDVDTSTNNAAVGRVLGTVSAGVWGAIVPPAPAAGPLSGLSDVDTSTDGATVGKILGTVSAGVWGAIDNTNVSVTHLANPNLLVNGNFIACQRGTTQTNSGYGTADVWKFMHTGGSKTVTTNVTAALDENFFTSGECQVNQTSGSGVGDTHYLQTIVENVRQFSSKTLTISFWAKASVAGRKVGLALRYNTGTGGQAVSEQHLTSFTLSTVYQQFTYTLTTSSLTGITIGGFSYLSVILYTSMGTNFTMVPSYTGAQSGIFSFRQIKLEYGNTATPAYPTSMSELVLGCARYYHVRDALISVPPQGAGTTTAALTYVHWEQAMVPMAKDIVPTRTQLPSQPPDSNVISPLLIGTIYGVILEYEKTSSFELDYINLIMAADLF